MKRWISSACCTLCLLAVERAAPFRKLPSGMDKLTLTFSMDYSLQ